MSELLRIVQVVNVRWFNATAWYGLHLSRLLAGAGHEVRVLCLPDTACFAEAEKMGLAPVPVDMNSVGPCGLARAVHATSSLVRRFRPHIVNCHRGEGMVLWGMQKPAGDFALVRTRGDQRPPKGNLPNRFLHTRLADAVVATNSRTANQCRTLLSVPDSRLYMIPGGVDTDRFFPDPAGRAAARAALGYGDDDFVVGLLGRFDAVKGHKELLEALRRVRFAQGSAPSGRRARIRLMLAGFPTDGGPPMEELVRAAGMDDCTAVTGKVERVTDYINAMDLGVIASIGSEAIARAAFEIMACGVPLIGTDAGVMPDLLEPCAVVPAGDVAALAKLLETALESEAFLAGLRAGQQKRMPSFSHQAFLEQSLAAYRNALRVRTGGTPQSNRQEQV